MEVMRVGVVGAGGMGRVHGMKYRQMPDVELHIYDRDPERQKAYCEQFPDAKPADSFEQLIESVDAVDVCLPTDLHATAAVQSLEAGKTTLVEKPFAGSLEDCDRMTEAAAKGGTRVMPAHVVRFFADYERSHNLIADGKIGKPASVRLRRGGKAPTGFGGWFQDIERSGGVILDLAVHEFDWLLWTLGPVKTVYARSVRMGQQVPDAEINGDYALMVFTHENGCVSHVEATWMDPSGFRAIIEAAGSEGLVEFDSRKSWTLTVHPPEGASMVQTQLAPHDDPYYRQLRAFVDAVRDGTPLPVTPEEGRAAVQLALASLESARTLQPVIL